MELGRSPTDGLLSAAPGARYAGSPDRAEVRLQPSTSRRSLDSKGDSKVLCWSAGAIQVDGRVAREPENPIVQDFREMARPGIEPGTPRFSVVTRACGWSRMYMTTRAVCRKGPLVLARSPAAGLPIRCPCQAAGLLGGLPVPSGCLGTIAVVGSLLSDFIAQTTLGCSAAGGRCRPRPRVRFSRAMEVVGRRSGRWRQVPISS